jgi:hypothetical protein
MCVPNVDVHSSWLEKKNFHWKRPSLEGFQMLRISVAIMESFSWQQKYQKIIFLPMGKSYKMLFVKIPLLCAKKLECLSLSDNSNCLP